MSTSAGQDQVQKWLSEAEQATQAQDWDRAAAMYRKALEFDRALQGVEAKLQWALRMREIEGLYQEGKGQLAAGKYEEGLATLRKARYKYASHYKDVDELIVRAQSELQKDKWSARPQSRVAARRAERQRQQRRMLVLLGAVVVVVLAAAFFLTGGMGVLSLRQAGSAASTNTSTGRASALAPAQRANMYTSLPPMQIDPNKSYRATIQTDKGNIIVDLFPQDAPQHVNSFVFLAREGFFNGLTFHRVEKSPTPFVIQGGDPLGNGTGGPGYTIPPEIKRPHTRGALAMARRSGPADSTPSSGSQFYIALQPLPDLDGSYTVFGQTTADTLDVIDKIEKGDVIKTITIEEK